MLLVLMMLPRVLQRRHKNSKRTRIQSLNCQTLLADERLLELDTALTEKGIDICALQETRRDGFMSTNTEHYVVYTFGECSGQRGVGFAIHKRFAHLITATRGIPDSDGRIMLIDILLTDEVHPTTLICGYAPPNTSPSNTREKFYSQLDSIATANAWLLGDFNARVGRKLASSDADFGADPSNTVGPWSLKNDITPNENGELLLHVASSNNLRHVASHFRLRDSRRWTWRHPRYRTRTVLDHVFVPSMHMRFIQRCFVPSDVALSTDHRPVICELNFRPRTAKCTPPKPLPDVRSLNQPDVVKSYQQDILLSLGEVNPEDIPSDELASKLRSVITTSAQNTIPAKTRVKFPEEFSKDTIDLIHRKRREWKFLQNSGKRVTRSAREKYKAICRETKKAIKSDRNNKLEQEAAELADAFNQDTFKGYSLLKRQHRSRSKAVLPPVSDFTDHYRTHYELGPEDPLVISGCELPPSESDDILTQDDFDKGISSLNSNRSAGQDNIAPEFIKHGGTVLLKWLFILMTRIWSFACDLPAVDRLGCLLPIPKKAGGTVLSAFRPICLLTSFYKLYATLVFRKVRDRVKEYVSWTQAGFISGRSCGNNLWILRRVAERAIEFNVPVYCALVDYKGAFDALNRTTLARVLSLFLSQSMVRRVMMIYFDAKANVRIGDTIGAVFDLLRGVRQGCPASPSFFTVALAFVSWTFRLTFTGIKLVHFHLSSIEYADDQILFTMSAAGLQEMLSFLSDTAIPFGLRLAPQKCELICFHRPGSIDKTLLPVVRLGDMIVPWKTSVTYLGSLFTEDNNTLAAVKHRICCAESVVKRLNPRVFRRRSIGSLLKGQFVSSAVFASLLYGLQYCSFGKREKRRLDGYYLRLTKRVTKLQFDYHLSYEEAVEQLGIDRPSFRLCRERLQWTGHALRSPDAVLEEVLTFVPEGGHRGRGRPRMRFYDTIKADLREKNIVLEVRKQEDFWSALKNIAADRLTWRKSVVNFCIGDAAMD